MFTSATVDGKAVTSLCLEKNNYSSIQSLRRHDPEVKTE